MFDYWIAIIVTQKFRITRLNIGKIWPMVGFSQKAEIAAFLRVFHNNQSAKVPKINSKSHLTWELIEIFII